MTLDEVRALVELPETDAVGTGATIVATAGGWWELLTAFLVTFGVAFYFVPRRLLRRSESQDIASQSSRSV
jgi:hypothetical protein